MIQHLTEIVEEARKRGKKRLAVAYGQDSHTLEAVYEAYKEGIVEPTLFGEKKVIEQVCAENDIDIKAFNIVDEASDVKCVQQAVAAVVAGNADVLMKGLVSTDKYMRGILNKEAALDASNVMLYCAKCDKGVRVEHKVQENGDKVRVCKKCGAVIGK